MTICRFMKTKRIPCRVVLSANSFHISAEVFALLSGEGAVWESSSLDSFDIAMSFSFVDIISLRFALSGAYPVSVEKTVVARNFEEILN